MSEYNNQIIWPVNLLITGVSILPSMFAIYTLMRTRAVTTSTFTSLSKNKFILILFTMSVCFVLANIGIFTNLLWIYYGNPDYDYTPAGRAHDMSQAFFFNIGVGTHVLALYLRTDASLIRNNWVKAVRVLMVIFTVAGILNLAQYFMGDDPTVKFNVVATSGMLFGFSLLCIDTIYTVSFLYFVTRTRKILGASKTTLTNIIATEGLKMTLMSMVTLAFYVIGILMESPLGLTIWLFNRIGASLVNLLWTRMKYKLDEAKERERNAAQTLKSSQQMLQSRTKKKTSQMDASEPDVLAESVPAKKEEISQISTLVPNEIDLGIIRVRTRTKSVQYANIPQSPVSPSNPSSTGL